jgi:hypothetical protein
MHIGWRAFGNVKLTRPYLPGRALWGGLTARLTRDFPTLGTYESVGREVQESLAFSYFYASLSDQTVTDWPFDEKWWEFSSRFLGSYASTALADGHSKEDGSLHETEYLCPIVEGARQVFLVGYILERDGCRLRWRDVLDRAQFGGERAYGWGRVVGCKPFQQSSDIFGLPLDLDGERPVVRWRSGRPALAHVRAAADWCVEGAIEPLVGRITNPRRGVPGVEHSAADVTWIPGSALLEDDEVACQIQENGIWVLPASRPVTAGVAGDEAAGA